MIQITDKKDCCGCEACAQRCPVQCITMTADDEGFLYPSVALSRCIRCGMCEDVCPVLNQDGSRKPLMALAAINPDEKVRLRSSSGGAFTALAETVVKRGGVVFGARFDGTWTVIHDYTETIDGLKAFQGSKYVQSHIGNAFRKTEAFLKKGREVMFTGTPCQIAGLRRFLRKSYDRLLMVDVICHGVPSPAVFRQYLEESLPAGTEKIEDISFRDKENGWNNYSMRITTCDKSGTQHVVTEPRSRNPYLRGFLAGYYLRPACYHCPAKGLKSGSDITVADFWGIRRMHPEWYDRKGTSAVLVNTKKGMEVLSDAGLSSLEVPFEETIRYNPGLMHSAVEPVDRAEFWTAPRTTVASRVERLCPAEDPSQTQKNDSK